MTINAYLITDPSYYTHDEALFRKKLSAVLHKFRPEYALYRDKTFERYADFAPIFVEVCREFGVKAMLHNDAKLAVELGAYGVHYSSDRICSVGITTTKLFQVLSTHKPEEIIFAKELGIDAVTYSPVFASPGKGKPVGLDSLKQISGTMPLPIIALGGILTQDQVKEVQSAGAWGFASIRYFLIKDT